MDKGYSQWESQFQPTIADNENTRTQRLLWCKPFSGFYCPVGTATWTYQQADKIGPTEVYIDMYATEIVTMWIIYINTLVQVMSSYGYIGLYKKVHLNTRISVK